jgi:hypothetical protein
MLKASSLPCRRAVDLLHDSMTLSRLAKESGFLKRSPRKVSPSGFIKAIMLAGAQGATSFGAMARQSARISGNLSSRQNMARRCGPAGVAFLGKVIAQVLKQASPTTLEQNGRFRRVVIQDSSIIRFADSLGTHFPAHSNNGEIKAMLRTQLAYDLATGQALLVGNDAYVRTDGAAAGDLIDLLEPGDLCLRDLGYYKAEWFQKMHAKGIFYLSRLKSEILVCQSDGSRIALDVFLKKAGPVIDQNVTLGRNADFSTRLVAIRLPPAAAEEKRRKLKQEAKRHNTKLTALKLALADWMILITNLPAEQFGAESLRQLYRLRWHVELVFKGLKSNGCLRALAAHRSNPHHIQALLMGQFLSLLINLRLWSRLSESNPQRPLSILKVAAFLTETLEELWHGRRCGIKWGKYLQRLIYHCRYDQRARVNLATSTSLSLR